MREHQVFTVKIIEPRILSGAATFEVKRQGDLDAKTVRLRAHGGPATTFRALLFKCYGIIGETKAWHDYFTNTWTVETVVNKEAT